MLRTHWISRTLAVAALTGTALAAWSTLAQAPGDFSTLSTAETAAFNGDVLICSGRPWIDVRCPSMAGGAVGDGAHDDTAAIQATIRSADANLPVKVITASRGKHVRAEPVAALYEQGRVHHIGAFPQLEDQMCAFVPGAAGGFDRAAVGGSPDRVDALVWALTELLVEPRAGEGIFETYRRLAARENEVP